MHGPGAHALPRTRRGSSHAPQADRLRETRKGHRAHGGRPGRGAPVFPAARATWRGHPCNGAPEHQGQDWAERPVSVRLRKEVQGLLRRADDKLNPKWFQKKLGDSGLQGRLCRLVGITVPTISSALGIAEPYAAKIRGGRYLPHPRHWLTLGRLVNLQEVSH